MSMPARFARVVLTVAALAAGAAHGLAAEELRNLAARGEGGHLVAFASQYDESTWQAAHLIDGTADQGWAGQSAGPQAVVIGFEGDALAEIEDVLINPYTREDSSNWVQEVEIQLSTTFPFRDFTSVGRFTVAAEGRLQAFSLPAPTRARYVKVVFLANRSSGYIKVGEVQVIERLLDSAPTPRWENVAAAAAGARIDRAGSQYNDGDWTAANLLAKNSRGQ